MRVLLDTHVLMWALAEPRRLDEETCATIENRANEVLFSAASIWEIAIKARLGRADFAVSPAEIARAAVDTGFGELAIRSTAASLVAELPLLHRDPFDRLLVAQAIVEPATLLTADERLAPYSHLVRRIGARSPEGLVFQWARVYQQPGSEMIVMMLYPHQLEPGLPTSQ